MGKRSQSVEPTEFLTSKAAGRHSAYGPNQSESSSSGVEEGTGAEASQRVGMERRSVVGAERWPLTL